MVRTWDPWSGKKSWLMYGTTCMMCMEIWTSRHGLQEPYDIETWQELLLHHGLQDVTGFGEYLKEWKDVTVDAAIADLGQWLADYCHTEFQLRISALPEFQ